VSLINQVLQDLEARRADPPAEVPVPEQVRAVDVAPPRSYRGLTLLLLGLVVVVGAVIFVWAGNSSLGTKLQSFRSDAPAALPTGNNAQAPAQATAAPGTVQEQVQQALLMPVFQLSSELSRLPDSGAPLPVEKKVRVARTETSRAKAAPGASSAQVPASAPRPQKRSDALGATPQPVENSRPAIKASVGEKSFKQETAMPEQKILKQDQATTSSAEPALEEVVIPADIAPGPIEKQSRQLTAFERAENAFRLGVASLRRGRMAEAETQFREAIREDRSHLASQQALVGILIDAGRTEHAEEVLAESLRINLRQPRQAMILARLQLQRGDLDLATQTLESARPYAGTDAVYLSFLGAVLQRAERHEEAVGQYRSALAFMPRNAIWLMGLGISLRALGSDGEALRAFDEAASIGTLAPGLQTYVEQQRLQLARAVN